MVTIWQKSQPNTKTSSGNVTIRYLLTIISFLPMNIRGTRPWIFLTRVLRGPGMIDEDLFRFDLFRLLVCEGLRKKLKFVSVVSVLHCLD